MDHQSGPGGLQAPAPEKSSELYIRDYPHRSIAIVSSSHALILRYSSSASEAYGGGSPVSLPHARLRGAGADAATAAAAAAAKCMVEFSPISEKLLKDYRPLTSRPVYGTLGLIAIHGEVFLSVITQAARAATIRPGETVERIISVDFYCLSSTDYDDIVPLESHESDFVDSVFGQNNSSYGQGLGRRDGVVEHPCHELRRLLSNGSFYYSTDFDVTNRVQNRQSNPCSFDIDNFDEAYLWNSFMISPLVQFRSRLLGQEREALDASRILTSAIRGFCKTMTLPQNASPLKETKSRKPSFLTLISRLSCRRAGTRFNARGMDDQGNVANFVETETTFWSPAGIIFSYVQVRGSVPVFWEQAADFIARQKITITRSRDATQPTFNKHFEGLEQLYGAVHVINLLSETKPAELELGTLYRGCIGRCPLSRPAQDGSADRILLRETHYDFHAETKGPGGYEAAREIRQYIENSSDGFAYFLAETDQEPGQGERPAAVLHQDGVFRTNCLDCLDRTNLIQTLVSQMAVEAFLGHRGEFAASDFWMRHSSLWADNGDALSKTYAGTGALKTSFTRHGKMSIAGAMADMRKSVQRVYQNYIVDPSIQTTIDMLLGLLVGQSPVHLFDPISDFVSIELAKRSDEYTSHKTISIWCGTFNLNGRTEGINDDLSPWLFPPSLGQAQPEIFVVAFQEIVELSPQQIMNSDPTRKTAWENAVRDALNKRQAALDGEKYVPLRSGQLVGAALCIFVKTSSLGHIKNVEGAVKKTGLSGMAGNKGAVAIRLAYANTQICFVTAHMAAGFANYDERNRDYTTIHHGLRFQRNRGIEDHDAIIWLGDFNYRIGLSSEAVQTLLRQGDLQKLYENDQLNLQMVAGLAFQFYSEAHIGFMPTYKFDIGSDTYDSSEKARIPAWTDRVLRKGAILRQTAYDSAPLRFSDHRPVYATFDCKVSLVDKPKREAISKELYERRKAEIGSSTALGGESEETDDEDLIGYDAIEPGLPPASSDRQKWWLENRKPARVQIPIPNGPDGRPMALNPNRASNPFGQGEESDWISVTRSSPGASLSSISSSPYEKIAPPRGMIYGGGGVARKLSSQYDAASLPAQVGRLKMGGGDEANQAPPPPPPRRGVGSSSNSNSSSNNNGNISAGNNGNSSNAISSSSRRLNEATSTSGSKPPPAPGHDLRQTQPRPPPLPPHAQAQAQSQVQSQAQAQSQLQAQALWARTAGSQPAPAPPAASRRTSQLSQQIKASRSAPPIARKPIHLSTSPRASQVTVHPGEKEHEEKEEQRAGAAAAAAGGRPAAPPKPAVLREGGPLPPPGSGSGAQRDTGTSATTTTTRTTTAATGTTPSTSSRPEGEVNEEKGRGRKRQGPVDLLDTLEGSGEEEMGGWETLQPSSAA